MTGHTRILHIRFLRNQHRGLIAILEQLALCLEGNATGVNVGIVDTTTQPSLQERFEISRCAFVLREHVANHPRQKVGTARSVAV